MAPPNRVLRRVRDGQGWRNPVVAEPVRGSVSAGLIWGDEVQQVLDPGCEEVAEDLTGRHRENDEQWKGAERPYG